MPQWDGADSKTLKNGLAIGISDDNLVQIDSADVASGEYAKFTANGLESKTPAELLEDLGIFTYQPGDFKIQAHSSIPTGFLNCDGSAVSRETYAALFAIIGTTWGVGDGSTTFNIPDLRAATFRGVGTSTQFTQNNAVTLAQIINDQMQGHKHDVRSMGLYPKGAAANTYQGEVGTEVSSNPVNDGVNGTPRTGTETTGKAVGAYILIKY